MREISLQSRRLAIKGRPLTKLEKAQIVIRRTIDQSGATVRLFNFFCAAAFVSGVVIGVLFFFNLTLSIAMGITCIPIPYLLLYLKGAKVRRAEADKLEQAMSMITNAYEGHFNLVLAIDEYTKEVRKGIPRSLWKQTPFELFVTNVTLIGYSPDKSLSILETQIGNKYFSNWVKTLRLCFQNHNLVFGLKPEIESMSDEKNMRAQADTKNEAAWRDYLAVVVITISITPIFRVINRDWYNILVGTPVGRFFIIASLLACLFSAFLVARVTRQ
jgi:Flp pilus assembly protein TadB